jgi:dephospho-CoA kinase
MGLVVGLTGGIGSGKSAVAERFAALGVPVIDADLIARELVRPGSPALGQLARRFGPRVLRSGELDRAYLRELVFRDPGQRQRLEAVLHPLIRQEIQLRIAACGAPYCIVVIPLLFETGQTDLVDRVLVVDAPAEVQVQRTRDRDGVSADQVRAILAAQVDRDARLRQADDILVNDGALEGLDQQVARLHTKYLNLAQTADRGI